MLDEQPSLRTATLTRPCASSETWKPRRLDSVKVCKIANLSMMSARLKLLCGWNGNKCICDILYI